ncbi:MAG: hypothetical protein SOZ58_09990 [Prevotella sp.]|nr:hypothetical protein [Prevotella sp.]
MQIKVFTLPAQSSELMEEEVNLFLRQHKVMTVDRQFNPSGGGYWAIFITYQEGAPRSTTPPPVSRSGKVDYREVGLVKYCESVRMPREFILLH